MKQIFFILLFSATMLYGGITGKLAGTIKDAQTGEPLAGATVQLEGTNLGTATGISGEYVILNIPPGKYSVKVSYIGYETKVFNDVVIIVDQTTRLDIELSSASMQVNEIVITAEAPLVQKDVTSSISVINRDEIEALPVATFTELLSLQAGVVKTGDGLHIRGGRSNEVAYLVDGMYVSDPLLGGLATQINNDAIQEMSLLSGTFNAEYGNALSGVVNIVTRDGTDKLSVKLEARTSEFGIDRYAKLRENRVNGSISGPLFTPDINYFLSGEIDKQGSYLPFGYNRDYTFFTKLSTTLIPTAKLTFSNRGNNGERQSYSHEYRYIPEQYTKRRTDSWQSSLTLTHTVANNFFYDVRVSYFNQGFYSGVDKDTSQYLASSQFQYFDEIGNGFEFYKLANPLQLTDSRTATADFKADAVWQVDGINEVKFGFAYKKHWLNLFSIFDPKRDNPYIDDYETQPFEFAGYVQDKIELPYLIINIGLRFDYVNANVLFRENPLEPKSEVKVKPRSQFSPRIGIAHPISEKTKLRFSYGHFFQNPDFQYLFENKQYDLSVREPIFGQPSLDAQRTISYEVGISHQLGDNSVMNVTAYYRDITGLIGTRYLFPYVEGRYTGYTLYVNEDYANIRGLEVTLDGRLSSELSGGLTYTYSVAKGSASSETEQYPGTQESTQLYYLNFDRTHVFNASLSYLIAEDEGPEIFGYKAFENMDISLLMRASSGSPYTPGGRDIGFVIKNSLRQPPTYSIDLRIGKEFEINGPMSLRVFAEALNITDHRDVLYVYRDTGEPDFTFEGGHSVEWMRDPSNYGPPRSLRLGLTFRFN